MNLDRIRARQRALGNDAVKAPPQKERPTAEISSVPPAPTREHRPAEPTLRFACGHDRPLAKVVNQKCAPCLEEERARARQKRLQAAHKRTGSRLDKRERATGRLPHESIFSVIYDASTTTWSGSLTIMIPGGEKRFEGSASGVFRLLAGLDGQYRAWLGTQEKTP
jgi:hypothetical protein